MPLVNVNSFGLVDRVPPGSNKSIITIGKENLAAIRAAIEHCKNTLADGIEFDPGFYYYVWDDYGAAKPIKECIKIKGFNRFEIRGNGATLCRALDATITVDPAVGFVEHDEFNISSIGKFIMRDITLTQRNPVSTQGTVTAVSAGNWWEIRLDPGFPAYDKIDYLLRYDPATGAINSRRTHQETNDGVPIGITLQSMGSSVYRVPLSPSNTFTPSYEPAVAVGDRMVLVEHKRGARVFQLGSIGTALFKDVRIPRASNLLFAGDRVDNLHLDTILVGGNHHITTVAAAGANMQFVRNVEIFNFQMTGFGDDFLNFHTRRWEMKSASGSTIRMKVRDWDESDDTEPRPQVGDVITMHPLDSWTGAVQLTVSSVTTAVTYTNPSPDPMLTKSGDALVDVTLSAPLPAGFGVTTWVAWNQNMAPKIRANLLRATRSTGRGLLWSSGDVECNDFKAEGLRQAGIAAGDPIDNNDKLTVTGFCGGHHYKNIIITNCGWGKEPGQGQSAIRFFLGQSSTPSAVIPAEAPSSVVKGSTIQAKVDGCGLGGIMVGGMTVRGQEIILANCGQRRAALSAAASSPEASDIWVGQGKLICAVTNLNASPVRTLATGGTNPSS